MGSPPLCGYSSRSDTASKAGAKDKNAVTAYLEDVVVGHVPHKIAPRFSQFLLRDVNKAFAEVIGQKINRGAGYRL